ncbi:MAG TPA: alpha/beta hydrolase-fold protein, partial [Pseudonocardiaceae bacterium]|nr:alpha/beta hydrolase-fold protein [Pseudonocardiaceae bacterium]
MACQTTCGFEFPLERGPGSAVVDALLSINLINGWVIAVCTAMSVILLLYLLYRSPQRRWTLTACAALLGGAALSVLAWLVVVRIQHTFTVPIPHAVYFWFASTVSAIALALANLRRASWTRKTIAVAAILVFAMTGTVNINAQFGLDRTVGDFVGVLPSHPIALPPSVRPRAGGSVPLWKTWRAPSGLPAHGEVGTQVIPNTHSGFHSRPAGIYLPPAALVPHPPALPLVILMMGQPGSPDPHYAAKTLDAFAARHDGLAPIVVVADQLGNPNHDTLCLDTPEFGNVETFLTQDVVRWATSHLNIIRDRRYWTIAGYSNGGQCAISLMAKHPDLWSNVLDVSGEEYPGAEWPHGALAKIFHGNQAAYDQQKPVNILAREKLPGAFGVFTVGADDPVYVSAQR